MTDAREHVTIKQVLRKERKVVSQVRRLRDEFAHMGLYVKTLFKWVLLGGIIGVAGGVIGSLFHIGVNYATAIRGAHPWILYLMPVGGLAIVGLYKLCHLEGKGTNAIIESVHFGESVPILLVPVIFVSTVITHLCGGSAGREGAALQSAAAWASRRASSCAWGKRTCPLPPCAA